MFTFLLPEILPCILAYLALEISNRFPPLFRYAFYVLSERQKLGVRIDFASICIWTVSQELCCELGPQAGKIRCKVRQKIYSEGKAEKKGKCNRAQRLHMKIRITEELRPAKLSVSNIQPMRDEGVRNL